MEELGEYEIAAADALAGREPAPDLGPLGPDLLSEFKRAQLDRRPTEERWLKDLRQYRGKYDPEEEQAIGPHRSRAFMRKTRVKVKTIDSRVADLLFPAGREKNWTIEPTPKPTIGKEEKAQIQMALAQQLGRAPEPQEVEEAVKLVALEAAKRMSATIEDQLTEARYKEASLAAIHSGHLFGTGILKGPLVERRVRQRYAPMDGKWKPRSESYVVPFVESVPVWRWYPDLQATALEDCRYVYEDHRMTKSRLVELSKRRSFNKKAIVEHIKAHPEGSSTIDYWDAEIKAMGERLSKQGDTRGMYQVIERWGWIDGEKLASVGVQVPQDRMHETFFANVWLLPDGQIIRAVLQPIDGCTWPYHLYYFDKDETSIFGEGLASIMRDDQKMLNAAIRMLLDNAAISAGPQLEVIMSYLSTVTDVDTIVPWKIWPRNTVNPGNPAIRAIEMPSKIGELSALKDMFEASADEVTAIPRYMSGENVNQGAAGTASGMSMLMAAANIVIKDLISSWDEGVTRNFLQALYQWNMQFHKDPTIKGDFDVKARGTASLVAKEVRAQQLANFAQMTNNPVDGQFVKREVLLREIADANELSSVVKTEDELKAERESDEAKQIATMQQQLAAAQLAEAQGRAAKLMAEADVAKRRLDEMLANIELTIAKAVETRVSTIYASTQAGGVAVSNPLVAPAADEILRSSNFKDFTPQPTIAQLNSPPVQEEAGEFQLMQKGQTFARPPRNDGEDVVDPNGMMPIQADPSVPPQTGLAGERRGVETQRID